jgi:hypothetical protein
LLEDLLVSESKTPVSVLYVAVSYKLALVESCGDHLGRGNGWVVVGNYWMHVHQSQALTPHTQQASHRGTIPYSCSSPNIRPTE